VEGNFAQCFTKLSKTYKLMKIGFICPNFPGHINPMTALARPLQARNHEVVFLYSSSATMVCHAFPTASPTT
jgi:spore coat polysaccharide biosynthesis predicted glycosyltransferase SpsG